MLVRVIFLLALGYAMMLLLGYLCQSKLVFMPPRDVSWTPAMAGLAYEDLRLEAAPGQRINAWFIPGDDARGTLIFAHGNGENIGWLMDYVEFYRQFRVNVLFFDYRGYGNSAGKPSENATYEDAAAVWKYLTETRGVSPSQIVIAGRSLGGAVAAHLANEVTPAGLILESSFTCVPDIGAHYFPWLPVRLIARIHYDTKSIIGSINCPVLIAHSPVDEVIPYSHGRRLFELAREPKSFVDMSAGHNDSPRDKGRDFEKAVDEFLSKCLPETPLHSEPR